MTRAASKVNRELGQEIVPYRPAWPASANCQLVK
jgi:hypothetical protein